MNLLIPVVGALLALLVVAVVVAVVLWIRAEKGSASAPAASCPLGVKVGDVVTIAARDHLVVGSVRFVEDGFAWFEHLLEDTTRRWISVEDAEGGVEVVLWHPAEGVAPVSEFPGYSVTVGADEYVIDEQGTATFSAEGATGLPATGRVAYADYKHGSKRLSFEQYTPSGLWEPAAGTVLSPSELNVWARPIGDA